MCETEYAEQMLVRSRTQWNSIGSIVRKEERHYAMRLRRYKRVPLSELPGCLTRLQSDRSKDFQVEYANKLIGVS
jgi:hypothetical protein